MSAFAEIFQIAKMSIAIAQYLGLVENSLERRIDKLVASELDAGLKALEQAKNSSSEALFLLREARSRFNKASVMEQGYRLVLSRFSLAFCHHLLEDHGNARVELEAISRITEASLFPQFKWTALALPLILALPPGVDIAVLAVCWGGGYIKLKKIMPELRKVQQLKEAALSLLETLGSAQPGASSGRLPPHA